MHSIPKDTEKLTIHSVMNEKAIPEFEKLMKKYHEFMDWILPSELLPSFVARLECLEHGQEFFVECENNSEFYICTLNIWNDRKGEYKKSLTYFTKKKI